MVASKCPTGLAESTTPSSVFSKTLVRCLLMLGDRVRQMPAGSELEASLNGARCVSIAAGSAEMPRQKPAVVTASTRVDKLRGGYRSTIVGSVGEVVGEPGRQIPGRVTSINSVSHSIERKDIGFGDSARTIPPSQYLQKCRCDRATLEVVAIPPSVSLLTSGPWNDAVRQNARRKSRPRELVKKSG
jgi:hypothetical protein